MTKQVTNARHMAKQLGLAVTREYHHGIVVTDPKSEIFEHNALDYFRCEGCDLVAIGDVPPCDWLDNNSDGEYRCSTCQGD